ncbi:hypothetical protein MKX70_32905 [Paenibacillus sp. FSL R7-0312]|uniref:hypothetical protein n=1 Tax=Paenibacillus sp. FSL R7-0312 TaxID=2921682 RepID=UPI0030F9AF80
MATTKLLFNVDEVERLRTKIGLVSQDTNRLHLQFKGKASDWGGIPLGQELLKAQVLIKELTSEAEKLEDLIRSAVQGVQSVQAENKRQAGQLSQQLGILAGLFGSAGSRGSFGPLSIPFLAQKAVTSLIRTLTILSAKDEWSSDPVVQKLRGMIQQSGLVSIDGLAAEMKLKEIYEAREQIGKSQIAYEVYKTFGNQAQMEAAHQQAEEARKKLKSMGISEVQYQPGKDLSGYYKESAIKACDYDPSITDKSVPLLEKEEYALLLRMAMEPGIQGEWAKQQLALIQPEATIGPVDPYNSVSEADILNRNDPKVIERLKGTYWFTLPPEEQDRRYEELKAYYEKLDKEAADQDRLVRSGVGNQTVANILMGGSNIIVQAINTASFGLPRTLGDWIAGPMPEGYVNPMDDPYGKKAGQIAGTFISIGLPWKYLSAVKTPGVVGKFSPTLLKSMVAGAISGTLEETMDAVNDYREDGKQSVGARLLSVGINTVIAGAGDALFTAASKGLANVKKLVNGTIGDVKVKEVDGTAKAKAEIDGKGKELEEVRVGGTEGVDFDQFKGDPARVLNDSGRISQPEEWNKIIADVEQAGGTVRLVDGDTMGYTPKIGDTPGEITINKDASLSALKHEAQHFYYDKETGWPGWMSLFDPEARIANELKAYSQEIDLAKSLGQTDLANKLWDNFLLEVETICNDYNFPNPYK